ncbi:dimethylaniline monooxygenase [Ophiostoma piceae UAMH 11346]|uniref:Dimethylaniline monooxygenase n=1 Tax=Ophiostoma piceae (strain UAMH 11346) TaxID=1262450 RepID=S3BTR2_OPHP1|nr:dimethylaniline monooxygenase [Ophiostoma piceae UAMH 11346]
MAPIKRVAVIGAGPSGAIAVEALFGEKTFDVIRGFERREGPGGCWIGDLSPPAHLTNLEALAKRAGDPPLAIPSELPATTSPTDQPRFAESSIYPYLETNVDIVAMSFSQEPIQGEPSAWSIERHGASTPFRPWTALRSYVASFLEKPEHKGVFSYNTTVEKAEKIGEEWKLTLRRPGAAGDEWWSETFDAVVVASGHFSVPYVPAIEGLAEYEARGPGRVLHSKQFRGRDAYAGKTVVVVGASVSAADIAADLVGTAKGPIHAVVRGHTTNTFFGDIAFEHPGIAQQVSISRIEPETGDVHFIDGTVVKGVDAFVFGTGYTWTLPFLPDVTIRNNRVHGLYQHVVWQHDPTLLFVGAVGAGLTFKIFEWQAVYAARLLSGRAQAPSLEVMKQWEVERIAARSDGPSFTVIHPDFEEYFEALRTLSGDGGGVGRPLPPFEHRWFQAFMDGHELRKAMWRRNNEKARAELEASS